MLERGEAQRAPSVTGDLSSSPGAPPAPVARFGRRLWGWFQEHPYLFGLAVYGGFAAVVFRDGGFGSSDSLPQGTNALNSWMVYAFYQHHPLAMWVFPFTDWGQPFGGFTGPTLLSPAIALLSPTVLVRLIEFSAVVGAGIGMMLAIRVVGGTAFGALLGGFYYTVFAQTSQLFEGHIPAMISVALGPPFLITMWRFLRAPSARTGLLPAVLLYLLISIGDLGVLYFYVFFAVLIAAYTITQRQFRRRYDRAEVAAVGGAIALVTALSLSWLYPFLSGVRPQYTTSITAQVLPFRLTSPVNLVYAYSGFVQDSSFVHFTYGQFAYGPWGSSLLPFSLVLPVLVTLYAVRGRRTDRIAFFLSGLLATVFATGNLYPGLSSFNGFVYNHVPFFNSIPELIRWVEYTILVYGVLLGLLVSDLERDAARGYPGLRRTAAELETALRAVLSRGRAGRAPPTERRWTLLLRTRRAPLVGFTALVVVLVLAQNVAVVTEPPSTFRFPPEYVASFDYLNHQPISGEVLSVPFGAIYERTPWGGVSGSSALVTPAATGADTAVFEAGTPYSLAMDTFISNGLTYGGSRNMSKFLGSANVQFIVATHFPNWNYSSSAISASSLSYFALGNQTGLGPATSVSPLQSIYAPGNWAGNLSFHPSYLLYFAADPILYSILDSPWYNGPSMALVNGSTVGPALDRYIAHAAGIVVSPGSLVGLGARTIALARANAVPIIEVASPSDFRANGTQVRPDAWNATGGLDLQFNRANQTARIDLASELLAAAGFTNLSLTAQLSTPPGANVTTFFGNTSTVRNGSASAILGRAAVNASAPGFFLAGEENVSLNSSRLLNVTNRSGTTYAAWSPLGNGSDLQYLRLAFRDLRGWNGLAVDVNGGGHPPLVVRLGFQGWTFDLPGYATSVPTLRNTSEYLFPFPSGGFGMPSSLLSNLGNLSTVELGLPAPGYNGTIVLSNLSELRLSTPSLSASDLGLIPAATTSFGISLPPTGRLGFLELSTHPYPRPSGYERDILPQSEPTSLQFRPASSGWGVLTLAQSFSPFWQLSGPGPGDRAVVDVGLTGWLINSTGRDVWHATYLGDSLESTSLVLESIAVPIVAAPLAYLIVRPGGRRGREDPGES